MDEPDFGTLMNTVRLNERKPGTLKEQRLEVVDAGAKASNALAVQIGDASGVFGANEGPAAAIGICCGADTRLSALRDRGCNTKSRCGWLGSLARACIRSRIKVLTPRLLPSLTGLLDCYAVKLGPCRERGSQAGTFDTSWGKG